VPWIILVATVVTVVADEILALNTTYNVHVRKELEHY
jgi:hypothetical protein